MDACEAMKLVMSRIQKLDGENGSRIIGYMLIQDEGEKEVIRLASGPDALLISTVNQVKACLGLSPSPKSLNPHPFLSPRARINGSGGAQSHPFHRRSYSVNDAEGGLGYTTYLAKNNGADFDDFLRHQQQRFGAHPQFSNYNKCTNFLNENQRCGPRNEFSPVAMTASSSRQIYLTFPADSAFKEEDVSGYFSMFGPVQDVRIPYQQKRMFGFVTFRYPETVKLILAKGNPHYVCDSRVLVKPYKEKGKVPDKKQFHQQYQSLEREGMDSKELFDPPIGEHARLAIGPRMLFDRQEMLRRQLEQEAELQNAMELQCSRMDNLQLMDLKYRQHSNRFLPSFPANVSISSPRYSRPTDNAVVSSERVNPDIMRELGDRRESLEVVEAQGRNSVPEETESSSYNDSISNRNRHVNDDDSYLPESLEHFLPGTLFASPTKLVAED